jgi:hypothetical protein
MRLYFLSQGSFSLCHQAEVISNPKRYHPCRQEEESTSLTFRLSVVWQLRMKARTYMTMWQSPVCRVLSISITFLKHLKWTRCNLRLTTLTKTPSKREWNRSKIKLLRTLRCAALWLIILKASWRIKTKPYLLLHLDYSAQESNQMHLSEGLVLKLNSKLVSKGDPSRLLNCFTRCNNQSSQ